MRERERPKTKGMAFHPPGFLWSGGGDGGDFEEKGFVSFSIDGSSLTVYNSTEHLSLSL